jgi:hypothetical protein
MTTCWWTVFSVDEKGNEEYLVGYLGFRLKWLIVNVHLNITSPINSGRSRITDYHVSWTGPRWVEWIRNRLHA